MLDQRVRDYILETGEQFPLDSLASIMRRAVDTDTADRMDEGNVDISDFPSVEAFSKKRENRLRSRSVGSGKGPDAMVYGISSAEAATAATAPPVSTATVPASPAKDPWAGGVEDPWAGAAQPQTGVQAMQPEHDQWALDAVGKGKGKGADKGSMQCYNCLGEGHPAFLVCFSQRCG